MAKKDNERNVIRITSIDQLPSTKTPLDMEFTTPEGIHEIKIRRLSHREWVEYEYREPMPVAPQVVTKDGVKLNKEDDKYLIEVDKRRAQVALKRLAACLQIDIPGDTVDDKAEYIETNFPIGHTMAMYVSLLQLHGEGEATVTRSETFQ